MLLPVADGCTVPKDDEGKHPGGASRESWFGKHVLPAVVLPYGVGHRQQGSEPVSSKLSVVLDLELTRVINTVQHSEQLCWLFADVWPQLTTFWFGDTCAARARFYNTW